MTRITDHPNYALLLYAWIVTIVYSPWLSDTSYVDRLSPDRIVPLANLAETRELKPTAETFSRN